MYKTYALAESLKATGNNMLHVLVVDSKEELSFDGCRFWYLDGLQLGNTGGDIVQKYRHNADKLRWSLKPVFMQLLLAQDLCSKIVYLDNDLFFYTSGQFLFDLLDKYSFLLTPHHYRNSPLSHQNWFEANYRVGLYNAGFVGASVAGIKTLQWWADCCAYRCEKSAVRGLFDDQKYLDLVPILEETAYIMRHKGCNVAGWNIEVCKREMVNGEVLIDGTYPVVFIHFNDTTIREIANGNDKALMPHYQKYVQSLKRYRPELKEEELIKPQRISDRLKYIVWKLVTDLGV